MLPGQPSWARPARRPPKSRALPGAAARSSAAQGRHRGGRAAARPERGGAEGKSARGGRPALPAPPPARSPRSRCLKWGRGGGGGIWRAERQLEAARRRGPGAAAAAAATRKSRGRRLPPQSEVQGPARGGAPGGDGRRFARLRPPPLAPQDPPRGGAAPVYFRSVFPARGRCPGRLRAGSRARRPRPSPRAARTRKGWSGGWGRAAAAASGALTGVPFVQVTAAAWSSRSTAGGCWAA